MPDQDYHRNLEIENAAQSQLLEPKRGLGALTLATFFVIIGLPLLVFWLQPAGAPQNADNGADEDLLPPPESVKLDLPPAAPPPAAEAPAPAQPQAETDAASELARQRADLDAAKRAADAEAAARQADNDQKKWERYRSPMVVIDASQPEDLAEKATKDAEKSAGTFQDPNPNSQLLGMLSARSVEVSKAEKNNRLDAFVPQGTMIRGVLETAVQTDLPGMVRAVTTEDVWSFDGRRVLIPSGTRLTGEYSAGLTQGQTRAFIVWTRLLRADGVSLNLGSPGTDELGITGSAGDVDNHYFERVTSAILMTVMQLAARNSVPVSAEGLKATVNIQPTISINQGTPIAIFVKRDLDFSDLYADPVTEKLKELKRLRSASGAHIPLHKGERS